MGSSLFPEYNMEKNPYIKLKFWQIFSANKKSSGEKVSIFIFEKKNLDKNSEKEKNTILQLLKNEPENLLKLKNNKNCLKVIEPLAEDSYSIGFITEYVNYNLKEWIKEYKPNKFEIKYIIYQIISVIISLHNDYQISHNNLNPENIFIDENNFLKISGLTLTTPLVKGNNNNDMNILKIQLESYCDLKYCCPELILDNNISNNSDNFIVGLIAFYLLKSGEDFFVLLNNNVETYKNTYENTNIEKKIKKIKDEHTEDFLKNLLYNEPQKRKSLSLIQNSKFFTEYEDNNNKLISLCLLSKMEMLELSKSYELLKLLPNILNSYSNKEKELLILPNLLYYLKKENLINPIIPSIFLLCEQSNPKINFANKIWPYIKFLFNMKKLPAAALYFILKKIPFLIKNLDKQEFNKNCIPLICKSLDCGVQKIQEVILDELPEILKDLDQNEFKNSIYNKLISIIIQSKNPKIKTTIMNFLKYICDYLDSYFINNKFLDDIEKIIKSETTIITCKNALILYERIKSKVNDKSIRSKIIPSLLLMMCNGEISEELFNKGEKIIQEYIQNIKEKRKAQFVQEVVEVNINENLCDEIKENIVTNNNNGKNIKNKNNINNEICMNSPKSQSYTKSILSGNVSLLEYNSSEDSNLEITRKSSKNKNIINNKSKNKTEEKKIIVNNIDNNNNNINDNLFDCLLLDDKNEENYSFDSANVNAEKTQSKNILKFVDKKEFLSSLELKQVEAKKKMQNNITPSNFINNKENEKAKEEKNIIKNNLWEEIESDDEKNKNEALDIFNNFIKKKKKSGSFKEKENKNEKNEKINDKIKSKKKWDEDDDEENNDIKDINDNINKEKKENEIEQKKDKNDLNNNLVNNDIDKNIGENLLSNNTENKDTNDGNKNKTSKKIIKKKKKKKKAKEKGEENNNNNLDEKINNVEIKEKDKENEKNIVSITKINNEKEDLNFHLEDLLDD